MAAEPIFVDTNVLVHAGRTTSPFHALAAAALARVETAGDEVCIDSSSRSDRTVMPTQVGIPDFDAAEKVMDADLRQHDVARATCRRSPARTSEGDAPPRP